MSRTLLHMGITCQLFVYRDSLEVHDVEENPTEWAFSVYRNGSTEENTGRWQLEGWVIRHGHSLLRKADIDNVTFYSLHKNLIYTLPLCKCTGLYASMYVLLCRDRPAQLCNREMTLCLHHKAPFLLSLCVFIPFPLQLSSFQAPTMLPSVETVSRRTRRNWS